MAKKLFINLPVADLQKSTNFYSNIGFVVNPTYTDESAACMVLTEEIYVMLLTKLKFREYLKKEISDTKHTAAVINSLSVDTSEEVIKISQSALNAGGLETFPHKDFGFMQLRGFEDLDGHLWEVVYVDQSKIPAQ